MLERNATDNVRRYSSEAQWNLADLIEGWNGELIVLHRASSIEFVEKNGCAEEELCTALDKTNETAIVVAFSDLLEEFVEALTSSRT